MRTRRFAIVVAMALVAAACGGGGGGGGGTGGGTSGQAGDGLSIAFIYDGAIEDGGWNTGHHAGMEYVKERLPGAEITELENIQPGDQVRAALEDLATQGYDLIVETTFAQKDVLTVARDFPDTKFISWAGFKTAENVGGYDLATEDGRYLDGIVAGSMTKSNIIGYANAFTIEEVVRGINAFALGAQSVNPQVRIITAFDNSWYDPPKERQAAQSLVDAGADILVHEYNSPAVASVAAKNGIYHMGYGWDQSDRAPESWLGSFTFDWGPYYLAQAQAVIDGEWKPEIFYGGLKDGMIGLSPFGPDVPQDVADLVEQTKEDIANGTLDIFAGPIRDNQGNTQVAEGDTIPFDQRTVCCQWFVEGVEGSVG